MKRILTFLFLVIAGFCSAADPVEHRAVSDSYLEPGINVAFPAVAGVFRKNEVSRSFNPMIGTKIRYSDKEGYCADIYIYSLPVGEKELSTAVLNTHYDEVKNAILALATKGFSLKKVVLAEEKKEAVNGLKIYSAEFRLTWTGGKEQNSFLKLFLYKGQVVKLRMSCSKESAEIFAAEIFRCF